MNGPPDNIGAEILVLAEQRGWPVLRVDCAVYTGGSALVWQRFVAHPLNAAWLSQVAAALRERVPDA